jgi:hypothetical protein
MDDVGLGRNDHQGENMMGGTQLGFGTPAFNPAHSLAIGTPWAAGLYGGHAPQQLLQSLQQLVQLEYIQQQQLQQFAPHRIQLLQQIQYLIQVVAQQQHQQTFMPQAGLPSSAFGGPAGWLAGTPGGQPQVFGGQAGYVM